MRRWLTLLVLVTVVAVLPGAAAADDAAGRAAGWPTGPLFKANAGGGLTDQFANSVATNPTTGEYLVAWTHWPHDGDPPDVYVRVFDAAGAPVSQQRRIHGPSTWDSSPAAAYNPVSGQYLVVWERWEGAVPDPQNKILARPVNPDGTPGGPLRTVVTGDGYATPDLAVNTFSGEGVVVFLNSDHPTSEYLVQSRRILASGKPAGKVRTLTAIADWWGPPRVTFNPVADEYAVAYRTSVWDGEDTTVYAIRARRLRGSDGQFTGMERFVAGPFPASTWQAVAYPDIACNQDRNEYLVVFADNREFLGTNADARAAEQFTDVTAVRLDDRLRPRREMKVNEDPDFAEIIPRVAYSAASGKYLVVFDREETYADVDVRIRRVSAFGYPQGGERRLSYRPDAEGGRPVIGCNVASMECLVAWSDHRRSSYDVFARLVEG